MINKWVINVNPVVLWWVLFYAISGSIGWMRLDACSARFHHGDVGSCSNLLFFLPNLFPASILPSTSDAFLCQGNIMVGVCNITILFVERICHSIKEAEDDLWDCEWNSNSKLWILQKAAVRGSISFCFCSILYIPIIHIYSLIFLRYMLRPISIRLITLSCFETNIYLRLFSRTHAGKPVSDR